MHLPYPVFCFLTLFPKAANLGQRYCQHLPDAAESPEERIAVFCSSAISEFISTFGMNSSTGTQGVRWEFPAAWLLWKEAISRDRELQQAERKLPDKGRTEGFRNRMQTNSNGACTRLDARAEWDGEREVNSFSSQSHQNNTWGCIKLYTLKHASDIK